jgi:hypothetical protein
MLQDDPTDEIFSLAGAMHIHDMQPKRDHLHTRMLLADHATLQPGVHGDYFKRLSQKLPGAPP